jgi:crotonobetainyl-CoA:carnitine CoA-transferase CaiB-like acyl-CoA transferase
MKDTAGKAGPMLEGIRVLDLTGVVFGPYATQVLADLGADVIKVEAPEGGDQIRWSAKAAHTPGMSPMFLALNRGKRSVALDLKTEAGQAELKRLAADADVFILNVRGKAAERLGVDYESIRALNPGIIYAHCVGFGQDGPYADLQAYDDVIQAASGATTLMGKVDGDPRARYLPSLVADKVAGLHAAYAVLAAIIHKLRTGEGQRVEIPMLETFTSFMFLEHLGGKTFIPPNGPIGYFRQLDPDRQPFPTTDGAISIVAYTDDAWFRLFKLLEAPQFLEQERFATRKLRVQHMDEMYREVTRLSPGFSTAELLARCEAARLPAQPVRDIDDILEEPHLAATGFFRERAHATEGRYVEMVQPVRFGAFQPEPARPAPQIGEDGGETGGAGWQNR